MRGGPKHHREHRPRNSGNRSSGLSTLSTLVAGLVFISVVIFMVAPHDPHELKKSLIQGEKDLVHRGEMVEAAVVDWVQKKSHLRGEIAEGGTDSSLKGGAAAVTTNSLPNSNNGEVEVDEEEKNRLQTARGAKSKNAYVTLISGIDESFKYRGFVYSALIMKKALSVAGSTADFIVMVGYSDESKGVSAYEKDMALLRSYGILIHVLPRWTHEKHDLTFAEMALLKVTPWSFTQYVPWSLPSLSVLSLSTISA
jgi:hypothetical protein